MPVVGSQLLATENWQLFLLLLYYITDRTAFSGSEAQRSARLLEKISKAALARVDYIQLREKDLPAREFELLAREAVQCVHETNNRTRLLINSRTDIAVSIRADGVHLRSNDVSPGDVRGIWKQANVPTQAIIAVSCHNEKEVVSAENSGADFVVFGPIFEKKSVNGATGGIRELGRISRYKIPVLALGGVTLENAAPCIAAGASGIAAIRLFQENDISDVVKKLRNR